MKTVLLICEILINV